MKPSTKRTLKKLFLNITAALFAVVLTGNVIAGENADKRGAKSPSANYKYNIGKGSFSRGAALFFRGAEKNGRTPAFKARKDGSGRRRI